MNKTIIIEQIRDETNLNSKAINDVLKALFAAITQSLSDENEVKFSNFGTFSTRQRESRKGRNPRTGEGILIDSAIVPTFKPSKTLKDRVNN